LYRLLCGIDKSRRHGPDLPIRAGHSSWIVLSAPAGLANPADVARICRSGPGIQAGLYCLLLRDWQIPQMWPGSADPGRAFKLDCIVCSCGIDKSRRCGPDLPIRAGHSMICGI